MLLVKLIVVMMMGIIIGTDVIDNMIRKWFGLEKMAQRKYFTKYEMWIKLLILLLFAVLTYRIGIESSYIYIVVFLFELIYYGFEAMLRKKYTNNAKEYVVTLVIGLLKGLLLIIVTVIYNLSS